MPSSFIFRARRRARRSIDARRADVEVRQALELARIYSRQGPEVLLIGDSAMFWVSPHDPDHRSLAQMISDELGGVEIHGLAGPGYNPRVVHAFLDVLDQCAYRPRLVVVPTSLVMATTSWLAHPSFGYEIEAPALRDMIASRTYGRRLPRADQSDWERYDRMPAHSLTPARRTLGEVRMIINAWPPNGWSQPPTKWMQVVRLRLLHEQYNAERLTQESPGIELISHVARRLYEEGYASMAYISPINRDVLVKLLKEPAAHHVASNSQVVAEAFTKGSEGTGAVVNASFACPESDFGDPVHLNSSGRLRLARLVADGIRKGLE